MTSTSGFIFTPTMIANMNRHAAIRRGGIHNDIMQTVFDTNPNEKAIDFLSYMANDTINMFEKTYGKWFDVIVDKEMKEQADNIKHRHYLRHGRSLIADNDAASTTGYVYDYSNAPNFYIYGERLPVHMIEQLDPLGELATETNLRAMYNEEQLIARKRKIDHSIHMTEAKFKAEEIDWNGPDILTDVKLVESRHTKAALRKHATSVFTYDPNEYTGDFKY